MDLLSISGSIGLEILVNKNANKFVFIFFDDHSLESYCPDDKPFVSIAAYLLNNIKKNEQVLLEEVPRGITNVVALWDAPHTRDLLKLYNQYSRYIHATDIRPMLIPFNREVAPEGAIVSSFIDNLDDFICKKGDFYAKYFMEGISKVKIKTSYLPIKRQLKIIINQFGYIKRKIGDKGGLKLTYFERKHKDLLDKVDTLLNDIMELYTVILIHATNKKSIVHMGLFHSSNIRKMLVDYFDFQVLYKYGITTYPPTDAEERQGTACVMCPNV